MPYCAANGTQLYYESHGDGPPVIFVHGVGGNHASWFYQIEAFSDLYRVIVYDQRGFGRSEDADGSGRTAMVDDLSGLLDHLEIERAVLVAQSLGGGTCVGFTARYPARVAGLVLCDTLAGIRVPSSIAAAMAELSKQTTGLSQVLRVLGAKTRDRFPDKAVLYTELASFNTYRVGNLPGQFDAVEPTTLAATGVPMLFIVGTEDVLCPPDIVRAAHALFPGAGLIEISDVGHSTYFEDPATFNLHLSEFLKTTEY